MSARLSWMFELPWSVVDRIVATALEEDLASGDLTTEACIDAGAQAVAHAVSRERLVVCGGPVFARVFRAIEPSLSVEIHVADGTRAEVELVSGRFVGARGPY